MLDEAKKQLHAEADYILEATWITRYQELLSGNPDFVLPTVHPESSSEGVLSMTHVEGLPIESLDGADQETRDRIMHLLLELLFREIFEFKLVQTDPNFANFLYQEDSRRVVLLDFGATREYSDRISDAIAMPLTVFYTTTTSVSMMR
ncbi:ubiquinone biosynthesis monooxygenase ubiB [Vibrio ishigakensis]|uniref:Ubiquinone biosynthesis monooxygenase ubiB n=1 Tax=Vibrio ishigakensis TaxID=1481914 RepID=A0A0B8QB92_9VIBR|nr:ubiquinone biosynthesis monooxygenase ubiB [Vibrio ishigakensis]